MAAIVAGGVAMSWQPATAGVSPCALLVLAACVSWATHNNLTRKVSTNDAMVIACLKGLDAGSVDLGIALLMGVPLCGSSSVRGGFRLIEGAVTQHGEQHVAATSGESNERLIVALVLPAQEPARPSNSAHSGA